MNHKKIGLRIVKIVEKLGEGKYLSENVFENEKIGIKFSGKQRMLFKLPIGAIIYVAVGSPGLDNARYISTWRNPFRQDNTETFLEKQRKELDAKYKDIYGLYFVSNYFLRKPRLSGQAVARIISKLLNIKKSEVRPKIEIFCQKSEK